MQNTIQNTIEFKNGRGNPLFISLQYIDQFMNLLAGQEEIVIPTGKIKVAYTFPFSTGRPEIITEEAPNKKDFTRQSLIQTICNRYNKIYQEADAESTKYGLWIPFQKLAIDKVEYEPLYQLWFPHITDNY